MIPIVRHMFYPNTTGNIPTLFVPAHHKQPALTSNLVFWVTQDQARLLRSYDAEHMAVHTCLPRALLNHLLNVRTEWSKKAMDL